MPCLANLVSGFLLGIYCCCCCFCFLFFQVYVVYMGSKTGQEDPDELLRQNHQILASVHEGRYVTKFFFNLLLFAYFLGAN